MSDYSELSSLLRGVCGTTASGERVRGKGSKSNLTYSEDDTQPGAPPAPGVRDTLIGVPAVPQQSDPPSGDPTRGVPPPSSAPGAGGTAPAGEPQHGVPPAQAAQQRGAPETATAHPRDSVVGVGGEQQQQQQQSDNEYGQPGHQQPAPAARPLAEDARNALQSAVDWLQASNSRLKQSLQDAEERAVRAESDAMGARRAAEAAQGRLDGAVAEARAAGAREARAGKVVSDSEELLKLRSDFRTAYVDKAAAAKEAKARGEEVLNLRAKLQELGVEVTAMKEQLARHRGVRDPGAAAAAASGGVNTAAEVAAATSSLHRTIEMLKAELHGANNAKAALMGDLDRMRGACDEVAQAAQEDLAAAAARELQLSQRIEALSKADSDLSASDLRQRLRDMQALLMEREAQEARIGAALGGQAAQKGAAAAQPIGPPSPPQAPPPSVPPPPGGSGVSLQLVAELEALRQEVVRLSKGAAKERDGRKKAEDALRAAGLLPSSEGAAATSPPVKAPPGMGWAQAPRAEGEGAKIVAAPPPPPKAPAEDAPAAAPPPPPPPVVAPPPPVAPPAPAVEAPPPAAEEPTAGAPAAPTPPAPSNELPPAPAPGWVSGRPTWGSSVSSGATPSEPHVLVKRRPNPLMTGASAIGTGAALSAIARKDEEAFSSSRSAVPYDDASLVLERTEDRPMPSRYNADDGLRQPRGEQAQAASTRPQSMLAQLASELRVSAEASERKPVVRAELPGRPASVRSVQPPPTHAPPPPQQQQQQKVAVVSPPPAPLAVPSVGDPSLADELAQLMESLGSLKATMDAPPPSYDD